MGSPGKSSWVSLVSPPPVCLIAAAAAAAAAAIAAAMRLRSGKRQPSAHENLIPRLVLTDSGRVEEIETFSHYVARQLGFADAAECPQLGRLAHDYLRKAEGCEDNVFAFFANEADGEQLYAKLVEELDRCILGYFAFHWTLSTLIIRQVMTVESEQKKKLKSIVMEATRKMRFERVTRNLKMTRLFSTLVEEMKAIGMNAADDGRCTDVMVPAAPNERSPVLLLMGGGMGAGKSTVLADILLQESFWAGGAGANAVVVEADAFKETDVIYRALRSRGHHHDILQTAELVHQSSADAASSLLVTALNEGRDVIMDGTLSWVPFVEQTIAMARSVHRHRYRMGVGYKALDDGTVVESYWERVAKAGDGDGCRPQPPRRPYRIELVGVVCDPYLAVVRGLRRAVIKGRAVRVKSQLESHRRFAGAFPRYCQLVDTARLYCTNAMGGPPKLIGWKEGASCRRLLVDPEEIGYLTRLATLNEEADNVLEVYPAAGAGPPASSWDDVALSPSRALLRQDLVTAVRRAESGQAVKT